MTPLFHLSGLNSPNNVGIISSAKPQFTETGRRVADKSCWPLLLQDLTYFDLEIALRVEWPKHVN